MEFHTFGDHGAPAVVLIHVALTPRQVWESQIVHFQKQYHVIVPALDAHIELRAQRVSQKNLLLQCSVLIPKCRLKNIPAGSMLRC